MINERKIQIPNDLVAALGELRSAVASGRLKQVWKQDAICGTDETIREIALEGPWDDYLELYFLDLRIGEELKLSVETYHGTGGSLERTR